MASITLDTQHIKFDQASLNYVVDRQIIRSQSGKININSSGSARRVLRCRLVCTQQSDKQYLRGVLEAAYYNGDSISLELPDEVAKYTGDYTGTEDIEIAADASAGSNTVQVRIGGTGTNHPTSSNIRQGDFIQLNGSNAFYTVNAYNQDTGNIVFHPLLRENVSDGEVVNLRNLRFEGFITNNISEEFAQASDDFLRIPLVIEEVI